MELIDSHCHIDVTDFDADRAEVLAACRARGVGQIVVPAVERNTWDKLLAVCHQNPGLYPALGLHPMYIAQHQDGDLTALVRALADHPEVVAVGEIGLDFYVADLDRERQRTLFEGQLQIAKAAQLPVLLHVRKAHAEVLESLKRFQPVGGIAHAFNGSMEIAKQYLDLGFKLGFGGAMTYPQAKKLRRLASELPLSAIVLETDAPDMEGEQYHGQRNSPAYLADYLAVLAELRGESVEDIAKATSANVREVLNLS